MINASLSEIIWIGIGFTGQFIFFLRFFIQWISSEKRGESYVPVAFWYLSIIGALIILAYAIYRVDPVFIIGQGLAIIIYMRNLILIRRTRPTQNKHTGFDNRL
ncbi:MAG: lipid-A-disaccharide synthase N-terminal domain-containing protein [Candidatus Paceibacterota bacterium]